MSLPVMLGLVPDLTRKGELGLDLRRARDPHGRALGRFDLVAKGELGGGEPLLSTSLAVASCGGRGGVGLAVAMRSSAARFLGVELGDEVLRGQDHEGRA